jgi:hypothetical protein
LQLAEAALVASEHAAQRDDDDDEGESIETVYAVSNSDGTPFFVTHDRKAMRRYIKESGSYRAFGDKWHVSRLTLQAGDNGYGLRNADRSERSMTARGFMDRG